MGTTFKKIVLTVILLMMGGWLLAYSWQTRRVVLGRYDKTVKAADELNVFPEAQYKIGYQLWFENQSEAALGLFRCAVSLDFAYLDAWLKMGEIDAAKGNRRRAMDILEFTDQIAPDVYRWKWRQVLLAHKLDLDDLLIRNINYLIPFPKSKQNALFLLDQTYEEDSDRILDILAPENYISYLYWLIRGHRVEDAQAVWQALGDGHRADPALLSRYVHFLLHNKVVNDAKAVWRQEGHDGIMNPKFDEEIVKQGFGWRFHNQKTKAWVIKRKYLLQSDREYAIQVNFAGESNINFHHFYQITPVDPGKEYEISWEWRSRQLTTDQRPFVEIYGFNCMELHAKGHMIPESKDWHKEAVVFKVPDNCEAVVIRLRRLPSKRFDSKISGTVWLDNFSIRGL